MIAPVFFGNVFDGLRQSQNRYAECTDYDVVSRAQHGEHSAAEYLLYKYRNLVRAKVKSYFLVGAEREYLLQVGTIGLWQSIVDFRSDRAISFPAFAKVCITRHIITAIKTANRRKQSLLNGSLSLDTAACASDSDLSLGDMLPSRFLFDPEEMVLKREDTKSLYTTVHRMLSDFEWLVLMRYKVGKTYREISAELQCNTKSVDNALGRIRRKLAGLPVGRADLSSLI